MSSVNGHYYKGGQSAFQASHARPPWAPSARSSGCSSGGERLELVRASPDWKWQHEGISSSPQTPATWFALPSSRATKVDFLPPCSTSSSAYYLPHSIPSFTLGSATSVSCTRLVTHRERAS